MKRTTTDYAGIKWADANPNKDNMATAYKAGEAATIEKACDWLTDYAHIYVSETTGDLTEDELINAFRKAMKGE